MLSRRHSFLAAVTSATLLLRVAFALLMPIAPVSDYQRDYEAARSLAGLSPWIGGAGLSISNLGPKLFYAGVFRVFGDGLRVIGVVNAILYATAVWLLYLATEKVFGLTTARLASALTLVSLSELFFNNVTSSEVLATLFICALYFALVAGDGAGYVLRVGSVGGLGAYIRSNTLAIGALVALQRLLERRGLRNALVSAVAVQVTALVVALPLAALHQRYYGRFTVWAPGAAEQVWYGNNPSLRGDLHEYAPIPEELPVGGPHRKGLAAEYASFYANPNPNALAKEMGIYGSSELRARYALGWIRQHPRRYLELVVARVRMMFAHCNFGPAAYLYYDPDQPGQPRWPEPLRRLFFGGSSARRIGGPDTPLPAAMRGVDLWYRTLGSLAFVGLLVTVAKDPRAFLSSPAGVPFLIAVWYIAPFALTLGLNRYKVPVLCLAWVYLAHGICLLARRRAPSLNASQAPR